MPDFVVALGLVALAFTNAFLYGRHARRHPPAGGQPRYPVSRFVRSFGYLMMLIVPATLADALCALFWLRLDPVPAWRFAAGLGLGFSGAALLAWSLSSLGPNFAGCHEGILPAELVRRGPYRVMAHPIYAANLTIQTAFEVVIFHWPMLVILLVTAAYYARAIFEEERALRERFGPAAPPRGPA